MSRFFLTTTIPYVNGDPHIGHALEYVQADAKVRYERLEGNDVYFLAGTDENALKNVQAAEAVDKPVAVFVEEKAKEFHRFGETLDISFNDFIRTTEQRHFAGAQKFWLACKPEDIYKKKYQGLYCVGCELFYTPDELSPEGLCFDHKKKPELVEEENYFFRLTAYEKQIRHAIESGQVRVHPENRRNEVLAFIDQGLTDFSISRSVARAHGWGVPVPNDASQIMYVWFDALTNYITALEYAGRGSLFDAYWAQTGQPGRRVAHVLGKGVARFHLVYWLGMLMSAGIPLPTEEFVHAYLTVSGEKMSKSIGNVINPHHLVTKYGTDPVRYFFLGAFSPAQDGDFSYDRFEEYYTAHLANGVGNLTSRIITLLERYADNTVSKASEERRDIAAFWSSYDQAFAEYRFDDVIRAIQELVSATDRIVNEEKPWERAKGGEDVSSILYTLAESLRHVGLSLLPIMPKSAENILHQLGIDAAKLSTWKNERRWGGLKEGATIQKGDVLFPRLS